MKKSTITLALIAAGLVSSPSFAQDSAKNDWVGAYGLYYSTDDSKPQPAAELDDGFGLGGELGFRFDESWAARISAAYTDISGKNGGQDESGALFGVDAMYFLPEDLFYVFGGLYYQDAGDDYQMLGYGLGKQWALDEGFSLISEIAAYRDLSESWYDYSVKLGVAYTFGGGTQSTYTQPAPVAPAPVAPLDSDNDGVVDSQDQCPNTPAGTKVDSKGCKVEKDSDNDGVVDSKDACPDTPAGDKVHPNGCTIFTDKEVSIEVRILFANNSDKIQDTADSQIVELAEFLKRYGKTSATIEGHSSAPGAAAYNKDLSQRRANALKAVLVNEYDIDATRLDTVGYGEERLLDTANTKEAHALNRRIEVKVSETIEVPASK